MLKKLNKKEAIDFLVNWIFDNCDPKTYRPHILRIAKENDIEVSDCKIQEEIEEVKK